MALRLWLHLQGQAVFAAVLLILVPACDAGEEPGADDATGSDGGSGGSTGASGGGPDNGDGPGSGGDLAGDGGSGTGGLGGGGTCDTTVEDYCVASAERAQCDGPDPEAYELCMEQNGPSLRYDSCIIETLIGCLEGCEPESDGGCTKAIALSRPDLFDWEQQELCALTEWNSGGGGEEPISCIERHKGWARECADFARSCDTTYSACPTAAMMRADLRVLADDCLEKCEGLNACLNAVIYGE